MTVMPRILLLLPNTTYRSKDFLAAAGRLQVDIVAASETSNALMRHHPGNFLTLRFRDPEACVRAVRDFHRKHPIDAVIPVDDDTAVTAAALGEALSLKHNSIDSALAARDKHKLSELLQLGGVAAPHSRLFSTTENPADLAREMEFPCVLKPLFLSASRGVIRANTPAEFVAAWHRIRLILDDRAVKARGGAAARHILIQEFIPGPEFALEGLLSKGLLRTLALFDKPDPLDGPFFEETIYITPSRHIPSEQQAIAGCVAQGAQALGLREGPIHAEVRLSPRGPVLIELAARSIGGLCSRTLRFGTGLSLEDLILRHALDMPVEDTVRESQAAGVMMIPIPRKGILQEIRGLEEARAIPAIEQVTITATLGKPIIPLPEGSSYLGFVFSRAGTPELAESALRSAHRQLEIVIDPAEQSALTKELPESVTA